MSDPERDPQPPAPAPPDAETGARPGPAAEQQPATEREAAVASGAPHPADAPAEPPAATGRTALLASLWPPRITRGQLVVAALLFILGLGLAVQMHAASEDGALRGARPEDLVRSLSDLDERNKRLEDERVVLERQITELENSSNQADEARQQNAERELQLGVLAGTVAATGPGIEVMITDPEAAVGADRLLDAVQELRAAGAEAIQINNVRVVASTAFADQDSDGILIDREAVSRPFKIRVIGSAQDLEPALNIPGGVVQSLEKEGATVSIDRPEEVTVDALRSTTTPDYAQSSP